MVMTLAAKDQVDFFFAENGLVAYKEGKILATESLKTWLGEDKLKELLNYILHYVADVDIPIKRGTFIEFRNGMLNVSPIGRNCSQEERDEFERFDQGAGVRYHHLLLQRHCFVMPFAASGSSLTGSVKTATTMCLLHWCTLPVSAVMPEQHRYHSSRLHLVPFFSEHNVDAFVSGRNSSKPSRRSSATLGLHTP